MSEKDNNNVGSLITGTISGLTDLYTHSLLEGLIPEDMSMLDFIDQTKKNREKSLPTYPNENLASEIKQSKTNVANLFKKKG